MDPKQWIDVTTEKNHYSLDHFVIPTHYEKDVSSILIPHGVIMDRVDKLARLIVDEATGPLVVCCILKGGHQYFSDLGRCSGSFINMKIGFYKQKHSEFTY